MLPNQGDDLEPYVRARPVATEVGNGRNDPVSSSTPPLEATTILLSGSASERWQNGEELEMSVIDAKNAYVTVLPTRIGHRQSPPALRGGPRLEREVATPRLWMQRRKHALERLLRPEAC